MGTFDAQLDGAPIAVVRTTADLLAVLKKRTAGLDMTLEAANDFAGLSDGYLAKLLGPTPSRRLGSKAFDGALGGLGLMLVVVEDPDAVARIRGQLIRRRRLSIAP